MAVDWVVQHLVSLPRQLGLVPAISVAFATAEGARGSGFVPVRSWSTGTMQVAAWWRFDGWTIVSDSRDDFQTAGSVDGQNVAGTALAAVITGSV